MVSVGLNLGTQPPAGRARMLLRMARLARIDTLWAVDHFVGFFPRSIWDQEFTWVARPGTTPDAYYDWQTMLGWAASRAGGVRLAIGVTEPIRRHPVLIAQAALTLSHLTQRAPILGIGAGERENIEPYGLDFTTPVGVLEEALEIIRTCFTSRGPFDYTGRHFRLSGAILDLDPGPAGPPEIWIAAHGPRMLRLTGRYGDGWYPTLPMTPDDYSARLAEIHRAAVAAGRDPAAVTPGYQLFTVIGSTRERARRLLETRPVRMMALLAPDEVWKDMGLTHPLGDGFRGMIDIVPSRLSRSTVEQALDRVPVDVMAEHTVWGTRRDVLERIEEYGAAGMRHVALAPVSGLVSRSDALYSIRAVFWINRQLRRR